jgi:hypothetical protein
MIDEAVRIAAFWRLFSDLAPRLARAADANDPGYDRLLDGLHQLDAGLYFELAGEPGGCELIITAEGERELFPLARQIVAQAPPIPGWTIQALKPKLGFPLTGQWGAVTVKAEDVFFEPLENAAGQLGLGLLVAGITDDDVDDAHNAVLRMLDHGLGEEGLAETIAGTKLAPLPAEAAREDLIALTDLPAFLDWRHRNAREV